MKTVRRLLPPPVLLTVAAACGSSGGEAPAGGHTIAITNFEFAPDTLRAEVGERSPVENKDLAEHTVTAVDRSFHTGRFAGGTRTFTVTKPGRFEYACDVHPFMTHRFIRVDGSLQMDPRQVSRRQGEAPG